jgi:2-oxoglutarate ferredoxin oxidoreductase subunit delta
MADSPEKVDEPSLQKEKREDDTGEKRKGSSQLPLTIFYHWCKGCNICIAFCPQKVFEPDRDGKPIIARPDDCTQCAFCWMHCPDLAIISNEK